MKAAMLKTAGQPLEIVNIEQPQLLPGSIKINVERAHVPSMARAVLSGNMPFELPVPYIPGPSCVGIVEEVADDVFGFTKGQRVLCGPHYVSRVNGGLTEEILIGWFGLTPGSAPVMKRWKNGAFAEKAIYPADCATPLGEGKPDDLIKLAPLCIAYGGLIKGNLRAGQTLLVNGATGQLGSATVLAALAMGASTVYAVGRNKDVLEELAVLDKRRVVPIQLEGEENTYGDQIAAQSGLVDLVIDILGYVENPNPTLAGLGRLKPGGTAVFMGGVLADIPINYMQTLAMQITIKGSFMHPASAASELKNLVDCGLLDLDRMSTAVYPLADVNTAIARSPEHRGIICCCIAP